MAKNATASQPLIKASAEELEALWSRHHAAWRDTAQIASQWQDASETDPQLLKYKVKGDWWQVLAEHGITLVVSREYEHLLMAMTADGDRGQITYMPMPHPSGIAVDRSSGTVYVASTRNPNQIYDLSAVSNVTDRLDVEAEQPSDKPLIPVRSRFLPGCLYMHDLALIGGELYANAVGHNAIVRLSSDGSWQRVWWPKCIETKDGPQFGQNFIQLNSIASGNSIEQCYFSASSDRISNRRPGHKNYPVDGRGVIFSAATREVVARGLTRPHSARLHDNRIWVDNSGYGEFGFIEDGGFTPITKLTGWTRGLCFHEGVAFVGTSRVIPRFSQYAPGLDVNASICGIHAVDIKSGKLQGSILWPSGNQIFAIDWLTRATTGGLPFPAEGTSRDRKTLFYAFSTNNHRD